MAQDAPQVAPELLARLEAVGGLLTGEVDRFGFVEVLTPYGVSFKYVWTTPEHGIETLVREWEGRTDLCRRPLAWSLLKEAQERREE